MLQGGMQPETSRHRPEPLKGAAMAMPCGSISRGAKRDKLKETNSEPNSHFSFLFAFFWEFRHFGGTDFHRKPQETRNFHRKLQIFEETRLSHLGSPF